MAEIPDKDRYKLSEVCRVTDTQPYVLRFWESEFPQLQGGEPRGGQRVYTRSDIDLVLRIKQLLYEEERTIAGAREALDAESGGNGRRRRRRTRARAEPGGASRPEAAPEAPESGDERPPASAPAVATDVVDRERYDNAVEEVEELRLKLRESEQRLRRAESASDRAARRLERLLESLASGAPHTGAGDP